MEGYNVTITKTSKELTHKERVRMKDTTNALSLDEVTQDGPVLIDLDFYAVLNVHNEKSESIDYIDTDTLKAVSISKSWVEEKLLGMPEDFFIALATDIVRRKPDAEIPAQPRDPQ